MRELQDGLKEAEQRVQQAKSHFAAARAQEQEAAKVCSVPSLGESWLCVCRPCCTEAVPDMLAVSCVWHDTCSCRSHRHASACQKRILQAQASETTPLHRTHVKTAD